MKTFKVKVIETTTREAIVEVRATDEAAAKLAAENEICSWDGDRWEDESEGGDLSREMRILETKEEGKNHGK